MTQNVDNVIQVKSMS